MVEQHLIKETTITPGDRIKELLNSKGWTQGQLRKYLKNPDGTKCDISLNSITNWVKDYKKPKGKRLQALAFTLGVDPEYISCNQLEKKKKQNKPTGNKKTSHEKLARKWSGRMTPEEEKRIKKEISEYRNQKFLIDAAIQYLSAIGIECALYTGLGDEYGVIDTYDLIEDGCIKHIEVRQYKEEDSCYIIKSGNGRVEKLISVEDFHAYVSSLYNMTQNLIQSVPDASGSSDE